MSLLILSHTLLSLSLSLSLSVRKSLVSTLILSYFDYRRAVLSDLNGLQNLKLQRALNACVRFIFRISRFEHIFPYFNEMKWLKV